MSKTALVTGAASGMGRIAAQRLAAAGHRVAAVDLNETGLAEMARRSPNTATYTCDVSDRDAVMAVVEKARADLGTIDHVVHAAGFARVGGTLTQDVSEIRRLVEVNYLGTVNVCQAVIPAMRHAGSGTVVLFASMAGWLSSPGLGAYAASKFAVIGYVDALYQEIYGSGVRLLCVCPPHVETPFLDGVRAVDAAVLAGRSGMSPDKVVDDMEKALTRGRLPLYIFPGQARAMVLARRLTPNLLRKQIIRMVKPEL
ncbi:SDR family NAD(P)-dependent oxidoreductase [Nocardia sp. CDC159]|uniref:SDR family NAD(P)-dependent oxidoreductase n=1 Tax=Nocardia pulmonis TaxID=2951408 RepID=A0A9X2IXA6_9NOCA|nr:MULTISPECIES: SDR family NAD(P)-dependent oxidoreductase [Nocardia]MCM6772706.1 SDR family NAD(P)-dependent oxidoreductase [Nocardia pulmonis]MCM6785991.1 SDR family NAD(P)-dependent oxidoreductase [Nocardia sp. CDC159]